MHSLGTKTIKRSLKANLSLCIFPECSHGHTLSKFLWICVDYIISFRPDSEHRDPSSPPRGLQCRLASQEPWQEPQLGYSTSRPMPTFPDICWRWKLQLHQCCANGRKCMRSACASVFLIFSTDVCFFFFYHCSFFFVLMRLFIYDPVYTPEPQTASSLHCYPASIAKHHGWLLEAGIRLQLLIHSDAQWDGRGTGIADMHSHSFSPISLQVLLFIHYLFIYFFVWMNEMVFWFHTSQY